MSIQTVENILNGAESLSFSERLTLMQRLLDGMKKTPKTDEVTPQQALKQILAKPAGRKLYSLGLDTRGFQFNREEANER